MSTATIFKPEFHTFITILNMNMFSIITIIIAYSKLQSKQSGKSIKNELLTTIYYPKLYFESKYLKTKKALSEKKYKVTVKHLHKTFVLKESSLLPITAIPARQNNTYPCNANIHDGKKAKKKLNDKAMKGTFLQNMWKKAPLKLHKCPCSCHNADVTWPMTQHCYFPGKYK